MTDTHPADFPQGPFLWRDLSWPDRRPVARLEMMRDGSPTGERLSVAISPGDEICVATCTDVAEAGLWCSGFAHAEFDDTGLPRFRQVPCPRSNRLSQGQQCPLCRHLDRFRPVHRVHRGSELTEAARAYIDFPHWLYVATFPDGTSKVGTAHERSKTSRLDQQAVALADYVALADDGVLVRELEDAVTQHVRLTQFKRVTTKLTSWLAPESFETIARKHEQTVAKVAEFLDSFENRGFAPVEEAWSPGEFSAPFADHLDDGSLWEAPDQWPSESATGSVVSGSGPFLLTGSAQNSSEETLTPPEVRSLVNMTALKNRACRTVSGASSRGEEQIRLF